MSFINIKEEGLEELFIALTTRWRKEDGKLGIGVPQKKLLKAGEINKSNLDILLADLKEYIKKLGLECIEYIYEGEVWYAIRSNYVAPVELESDEEAILAVIISLLEDTKQQKIGINTIKKKLILGKYCSEYQFKSIFKSTGTIRLHSKKEADCKLWSKITS